MSDAKEDVNLDILTARRYTSKENSARKKNIPFSLSFGFTRELVNACKCAYTGVCLTLSDNRDSSLTFERIDPLDGYSESNTVTVSAAVNHLKGSTLDVFLHDKTLSDEIKLRILNKIVYRLRKRIETKKKDTAVPKATQTARKALSKSIAQSITRNMPSVVSNANKFRRK